MIKMRWLALVAISGVLLLHPGAAPAQIIVNIDATKYGFRYPGGGSDPAPMLGQTVIPVSNAPGGGLNQLSFPAGTYSISNATGMSGANPSFTAWNYSSGWVWSVVIINDATHTLAYYADRGGVQGSQAAIANTPAVINFMDTFTLTSPAVLDFAIRDYFLPDNSAGVAVFIQPVPEPGSLALVGLAAFGIVGRRWWRRAGKLCESGNGHANCVN